MDKYDAELEKKSKRKGKFPAKKVSFWLRADFILKKTLQSYLLRENNFQLSI